MICCDKNQEASSILGVFSGEDGEDIVRPFGEIKSCIFVILE
ncbi:MAG: hypothetical protein ACRCUY_02060 [Thermoguttaceae bacterium]